VANVVCCWLKEEKVSLEANALLAYETLADLSCRREK